MPNKFIIAVIISAVTFFLPLLSVASAPRDAADKNWTFHCGFDNMPRKIMVTPDKVYFFVHQSTYNNTDWSGYVNDPSGAVFLYDAANPSAGLQDMSRKVAFSGFDMRQAAIDPITHLIVIAYSDGGIDLVSPDYTVKYLDNLKKMHLPGASKVNAISFDPETHDIWISTGSGFMKIGYPSLEPEIVTAWDKKVSDIVPVGENIFAIIDGKICSAPASADLHLSESFTEVAGVTTGTPSRLMPLSPIHVDYLTSNNGMIQQLKYSSGKWTRKQITGASAVLKVAKQAVVDRVEHTVMPTATGYYIASNANAYLLNRPATDGTDPTCTTRALPSGSTLFSGSYDGETFWFYRDRGEFTSRRLDGTAWSEPEKVLKSEGPVSYKDLRFLQSDKYGLVAINQSPIMRSGNIYDINPMLLSAYRNGKWTNLSPCYHTPYVAENNEAALTALTKNITNYPVSDPMGGCIDPRNPDVLFAGSCSSGVAAVYLDDPKKTPLMFRGANDTRLSGISFIPIYEASGWSYYNAIYPLGFDGKDNFWAYRTLALSSKHPTTNIALYCWTPEDRADMLKDNDPTANHGIKEFIIDNHIYAEFWVLGTTLRYPGNDTKLIMASQGFDAGGRSLRIYDHKGTVDDTTDDTLDYIYKFRTDSGMLAGVTKFNGFLENPSNGDLIALGQSNVYIFNPSESPVDGIIDARILSYDNSDGAVSEFLPSLYAVDAVFDSYGRLWISTDGAGVIGFTPDYSKVVAHYTTRNSPLPSNRTYGLGWNKDTGSLMISTEYGIAEVKVDATGVGSNSDYTQQIVMIPEKVSPEYGGSVAFHNLPSDINLRVCDSQGKTVALLERDGNGQTVWHLTDLDGNEVSTGMFVISDASGSNTFEPIYLPVVRN